MYMHAYIHILSESAFAQHMPRFDKRIPIEECASSIVLMREVCCTHGTLALELSTPARGHTGALNVTITVQYGCIFQGEIKTRKMEQILESHTSFAKAPC